MELSKRKQKDKEIKEEELDLSSSIQKVRQGLHDDEYKYDSAPGNMSTVPKCYHLWFIDEGYRQHNATVITAATSLFRFHNQTMNTWTHLLGGISMLIAFVDWIIQRIVIMNDFDELDATFAYYLASASICFFCSSAFHWFQCISEGMHKNLLRLDLTGASLLVAANFVGVIYYGIFKSLN